MRAGILRVVLPVVAGMTAVIGGQGVAHADTSWCERVDYGSGVFEHCEVEQVTAAGNAQAHLWYSVSATTVTPYYANGVFYNTSGYSINTWLQRRSGTSGSWANLFGPYLMASGVAGKGTNYYYDGPGYQMRSCFQFTWSGAALHCTSPF